MKKRTFISIIIIAIAAIAVVFTIAYLNRGTGTAGDVASDNGDFDAGTEHKTEDLPGLNEALEIITEQPPQDDPEVLEPLNADVWTTDRVNFRSGQSTESEIIERIPRGTQILLQQDLGEWSQVAYNGKQGYVASEYISHEEPTTNGIVVCIDPGHQLHGDSTPEPNGPGSSVTKARVTQGTTGKTTGVPEYQLTLDVSLKLKDELESRGYTVVMTRDTHDINISNMERAQLATAAGADITVRIHANGADSSSTNGALAMVPTSSNPYISSLASESSRLGTNIINAYCASTGMNNLGVQGYDNMTGINFCTMPVTILEMGFMTNPTDDTNMQDGAYQQNMVKGIADGIDSYFAI